jgi:hypothetical protein
MSNLNAEQKLSSCEAVKHDAFKPPLGLIPKSALDEEAAVFGFGAKKYDAHNWRKGMPWSRLISAAMRHLVDFNDGQDFDKESGLHALAHVRACCGFLIEYMVTHPELDDRFKRPAPIVPIATEAQLAEWAKNADALQQQAAEKNERARRALESLARPDIGQSKTPPWLMK